MTEQIELTDDMQVIFNKEIHKALQALFALKQTMPQSETLEGGKLDIATKACYALRDQYDTIPF
jgi:hypothetical protein